jgi:hypothetical protein
MEIEVTRKIFQEKDTIGDLTFPSNNNNLLCNTLELPMPADGNYTHGFCIVPGRYKVQIVFSPALQHAVPQLVSVPGREYIEIHWGNAAKDTHGCILTGNYEGGINWVDHSIDDFSELMDILYRAVSRKEDIWITIKNKV